MLIAFGHVLTTMDRARDLHTGVYRATIHNIVNYIYLIVNV